MMATGAESLGFSLGVTTVTTAMVWPRPWRMSSVSPSPVGVTLIVITSGFTTDRVTCCNGRLASPIMISTRCALGSYVTPMSAYPWLVTCAPVSGSSASSITGRPALRRVNPSSAAAHSCSRLELVTPVTRRQSSSAWPGLGGGDASTACFAW